MQHDPRSVTMKFRTPLLSKELQDWSNLLLGIWLCLSPWLFRFSEDYTATQNIVAVGFLIIVFEVFTFYSLRKVEEWINVILGAWLAISVWVLGIKTFAAQLDSVVVGSLIVLLGLYEIWDAGRRPPVHQS